MMAPVEIGTLVAALGLTAVVPYVAIRTRESLRRWALLDAAILATLLAVVSSAAVMGVNLAPRLAIALLLLGRVALFVAWAAADEEVRWNATLAAVLAGGVYLLLIPHVLRVPIDGDEPFYALVTKSIVEDRDLDLRNQYDEVRLPGSELRRPDLKPQEGDPVGPHGEKYSRHEPFLPLLLVPGWLLGGLPGAVAVIALCGALLARSLALLLEEERFPRRARILALAGVVFGPPVLFYATRIWPEVPAALALSEALRASLRIESSDDDRTIRRAGWWLAGALLFLSLLKIRFVAIAALMVGGVARRVARRRGGWKFVAAYLAALGIPFVVALFVTGNLLNVHQPGELALQTPGAYLKGFFGSLVDGSKGLLFQAPLWFLAIFSLADLRRLPRSLRLGAFSSLLYLVLLFPRPEWHGGWSPPLRYLVVFAPLFALGLAWMLARARRWMGWTVAAVWTLGHAAHGIAWPWRLFHLTTGESLEGEWLSRAWQSDFSRFVPSLIRVNAAGIAWAAGVVVLFALYAATRKRDFRWPQPVVAGAIALLLALVAVLARQPARAVEFEDAHVQHKGGELFPYQWTVARFLYPGGWSMRQNDSMTFLYEGGPTRIRYYSKWPTTIVFGDSLFDLPSTGGKWVTRSVPFPRVAGRAKLTVIAGGAIFDRIEHE